MVQYYCLGSESRNISLMLGVNDVPILKDYQGHGLITIRPINEWLMPQGNRCTAFLTWPGTKPYSPGQAVVNASLFIADPNASFPKPGKTLLEFKWPAGDQQETYPYKFDQAFDVDEAPPTRLWREAETLRQINGSDQTAVLELIAKFRERVLARDVNGAFDLVHYRYVDDALANGYEFETVRRAVTEQYAMLMEVSDLGIEPVDVKTMVLSTVANDLVLWVRKANNDEALVATTAGARFGFQMYFAKIAGQWTIVR